jgi:hypothetical protein
MQAALLGYGNDPPASPPLPSTGGPDVNFTFDHQPQAWSLNTYADPNYTNIAANVPSGTTPPTLTVDLANGNPNPGSLKVMATFTALDQYVDPQVVLYPTGLNLTGKTLHGWARLVTGSLAAGGLQMHASTGSNYVWGSTQWVAGNALSAGDWVPINVELSAVSTRGFDPSQVIQIGVQIFSGFSASGGSFVDNGPVVIEIDTVTD